MKNRWQKLVVLLAFALVLTACGKKEADVPEEVQEEETVEFDTEAEITEEDLIDEEDAEEEGEETEEVVEEEEEKRDGYYRSELTNEWISDSLWGVRPVAIMVDNEIKALPHFGLNEADIIYEMMNSTQNDRITRFMCLFKDWRSIERVGSIRSVRPTNFMIAPEYNAVVIHDGGPMYINAFLSNPWVEHLSGGFARIDNGKPREFTEYVTKGEVEKRLKNAKYSETYNEWNQGGHFKFASEKNPIDLSKASDSKSCNHIALPFKHNGSELKYDEGSQTYKYSEYGKPHNDGSTGVQLAFKNLIVISSDFTQYDEHGYMQYNLANSKVHDGYYITNGSAVPVTWEKNGDLDQMKFIKADGENIVLNTGKTYIAIVPSDVWSQLVIE